jgi:hypothetical protein
LKLSTVASLQGNLRRRINIIQKALIFAVPWNAASNPNRESGVQGKGAGSEPVSAEKEG